MIIGNKVLIRAVEEDNLPDIYEWSNDFEIKELFDLAINFTSYDEFIMEFYEKQKAKGIEDNVEFVIVETENKRPVGECKLINLDFTNRRAMCTLYIGDVESRDKGYGTEAMKLLMKFAFADIDLNRLSAWVFEFNKRAIKSYKKCGMKVEGIMREGLYRDGDYRDIYLMGIIKSEYKEMVKGENE